MSESIIPTGWALVPIEPTREMWAAGGNNIIGYKQRHHDKVVGDVWTAMLSAAPAAPAPDAAAIRREERERCARVADDYAKRSASTMRLAEQKRDNYMVEICDRTNICSKQIAFAIRALSDHQPDNAVGAE